MITPENLVRHELIGLSATVRSSTDPGLSGIAGRVVDETRNTIVLEVKDGHEVTIVKDQCVIAFRIPSGESVRVEGRLLVARPEDRIKKKLPKC